MTAQEEIVSLRAEVATLKEALEDLSDHGSAFERFQFIKAQKAEIERLRALIKEL